MSFRMDLACSCCRTCGRIPSPAFALYTTSLSHNTVPLCRSCLNMWLDNADDDPEMEPAALRFLLPGWPPAGLPDSARVA